MSSIVTTEQKEYLELALSSIVERVNFDSTREEIKNLFLDYFEGSEDLMVYVEPLVWAVQGIIDRYEDVFDEHAMAIQIALDQRDRAIDAAEESDRNYIELQRDHDILRTQLSSLLFDDADEMTLGFEDRG